MQNDFNAEVEEIFALAVQSSESRTFLEPLDSNRTMTEANLTSRELISER